MPHQESGDQIEDAQQSENKQEDASAKLLEDSFSSKVNSDFSSASKTGGSASGILDMIGTSGSSQSGERLNTIPGLTLSENSRTAPGGAGGTGSAEKDASFGERGTRSHDKERVRGEEKFPSLESLKEVFDLQDPTSDASIKRNAAKVLDGLHDEKNRGNVTNLISDAIRNGTIDKLVEQMNKQLKERGSDMVYTLDNKQDNINPNNVDTTINLFDSKTGKKLDMVGIVQPKEQLQRDLGNLSGAKDAGFNPDQTVAAYNGKTMSEKEVADAGNKIVDDILQGNGKNLDIMFALKEAEKKGSLDALMAGINKELKERGLDLRVGMKSEKQITELPGGIKWDDPLNTFNNHTFTVIDATSGKQVNEVKFNQSYYDRLSDKEKNELFAEMLRRR